MNLLLGGSLLHGFGLLLGVGFFLDRCFLGRLSLAFGVCLALGDSLLLVLSLLQGIGLALGDRFLLLALSLLPFGLGRLATGLALSFLAQTLELFLLCGDAPDLFLLATFFLALEEDESVLVSLATIRALAQGLDAHVDRFFGVCPALQDLVEGDREFQFLARRNQALQRFGGPLARGGGLHQVQATEDLDQSLVGGNGTVSGQPQHVGPTGRAQHGQFSDDFASRPQVFAEVLDVHAVRLLEDILQVFLERHGRLAQFIQARGAHLANAALEV